MIRNNNINDSFIILIISRWNGFPWRLLPIGTRGNARESSNMHHIGKQRRNLNENNRVYNTDTDLRSRFFALCCGKLLNTVIWSTEILFVVSVQRSVSQSNLRIFRFHCIFNTFRSYEYFLENKWMWHRMNSIKISAKPRVKLGSMKVSFQKKITSF